MSSAKPSRNALISSYGKHRQGEGQRFYRSSKPIKLQRLERGYDSFLKTYPGTNPSHAHDGHHVLRMGYLGLCQVGIKRMQSNNILEDKLYKLIIVDQHVNLELVFGYPKRTAIARLVIP